MKIHLKTIILLFVNAVMQYLYAPSFQIPARIDVSLPQVIMGRNSFMPAVYPMISGNQLVDTLVHDIINDSIWIEIL